MQFSCQVSFAAAHVERALAATGKGAEDQRVVVRVVVPRRPLRAHTAETYQPGTGYGGTDGADGRGARYLEWAWDPDPADTWTLTEYAFLLREPGGAVRAVHETHRLGLFGRGTWLRLLEDAGFRARAVTEETSEDRHPRELFAGAVPA